MSENGSKNGIKWQNITIAHNAPKTRYNAIKNQDI
jgi:hypothetical protein